MTKTIGETKVKHISLLILKISLLTLFGCWVKIHKINPIFGYRVKITPDINPTYDLMDLQKGMTIVCRSYVISRKFIYPIDECGVRYPPDINPIFG